ncbi:MAG: sulfotransferase family 2 domain-containing protein [Paracoccaceae bacterium]
MAREYSHFIVLAGMRTGSNYLEENLNEYPGIFSHGELFNPHFIGGPNKSTKLGVSLAQRTEDPSKVIDAIINIPGQLNGFRFFYDHDQRVFDSSLADENCAKIVLTRNPIETYISREIVRQTQQWRLGDFKSAKSARVTFDADDFSAHLEIQQQFQSKIKSGLQKSGQTAFYLSYDDIPDQNVLNGLVKFLGVDAHKKKTTTKTKKQNPQALDEKVVNYDDMLVALGKLDLFAIDRHLSFEPARGAVVPTYIAAPKSPLLYAPIASGPTAEVARWLADLDGEKDDELIRGFTQKSLRQWKRKSKNHRTFTVIRHPVVRLHTAFVQHILMAGPLQYTKIRNILTDQYGLPIPDKVTDQNYDAAAHRAALLAFAEFIKGNLNGQTSIRVDAAWASQSEILRGISQFATPDHVFRETDLSDALGQLADGCSLASPKLTATPIAAPVSLEEIYDQDVEAAIKSAYQRDYMMFGFGQWRP